MIRLTELAEVTGIGVNTLKLYYGRYTLSRFREGNKVQSISLSFLIDLLKLKQLGNLANKNLFKDAIRNIEMTYFDRTLMI